MFHPPEDHMEPKVCCTVFSDASVELNDGDCVLTEKSKLFDLVHSLTLATISNIFGLSYACIGQRCSNRAAGAEA